MTTNDAFNQAYQRCLQLLSRREYAQQELRQKLKQYQTDPHVIDDCLARLLADNYQSDQRFAEMFCRTRVSQRHGSKKIRYELQQKGIDETLIETALAEYQTAWVENAAYLIQRKAPRANVGEIFNDFTLKSKISRFLLGKGYDYDTINHAFELLRSESDYE